MTGRELIRLLAGYEDYIVDIGLISQYPNTINAERVLVKDSLGVVVIEGDDV